ncbi:helix-turn-helix domain-containing protein [Actinomadura rubrisoli]|uniref:XRE family transcriptional regulator n=1 Tax=Actinomadura rubrisoli TaxID=2530368 RepID=A0A4V2YY83_9ACTN|nr:helix-turn-helix transcriptional regulator [Actinomadura rubrisoli]TDD92247.1 XRE family transcriptional regulator [Actinomadura rubrisoli]
MAPRSSPTARRRRLATALRQLRETRKLSCAEVGRAVGWSESKVSRIETGRTGIRADDLDLLLRTYEVDEEMRKALHVLRRQASHRGWWSTYGDALPAWFQGYVGLEDGARSVMIYQGQLVPGLMQTDDYATAVMRAHQPSVAADEIERQLAARAARQALLTSSDALEVWTVLDEAVLRRVVGGPETMKPQLQRLREIAGLPNVTLQVLPFAHGAHAAMGTSFIHLKFPEPGDADIVYIEDLTSSQYLEEPEDIERYSLVADHLRASALPPEASTSFIKCIADAMS